MRQIRTILVLSDGQVEATDWLRDDGSDEPIDLMLDAIRSILGSRWRMTAAFWQRRTFDADTVPAERRRAESQRDERFPGTAA